MIGKYLTGTQMTIYTYTHTHRETDTLHRTTFYERMGAFICTMYIYVWTLWNSMKYEWKSIWVYNEPKHGASVIRNEHSNGTYIVRTRLRKRCWLHTIHWISCSVSVQTIPAKSWKWNESTSHSNMCNLHEHEIIESVCHTHYGT